MWKQKGFTRTERDPVNNEIDVDWMEDMESDSFFFLEPSQKSAMEIFYENS